MARRCRRTRYQLPRPARDRWSVRRSNPLKSARSTPAVRAVGSRSRRSQAMRCDERRGAKGETKRKEPGEGGGRDGGDRKGDGRLERTLSTSRHLPRSSTRRPQGKTHSPVRWGRSRGELEGLTQSRRNHAGGGGREG